MTNAYYEPARFPKRFVAYLIDVYLVGIFFIFLGSFSAVFSPILGGIFILLGVFGYFLIKDGIYNGQSLGKIILGLKVVKFSDQKQAGNLIDSIIRNIVLEIPIAPLYAALQLDGDGDGRRIGDGLADTIVIDLKKPSKNKVKGEVKKSSGILIWIILLPVIIVLLLVGVGMVLQLTAPMEYNNSYDTDYVPFVGNNGDYSSGNMNNQTNNNPVDADSCESQSYSVQKDICYYNKALDKNDSAICLNISSSDKKDDCYKTLAQLKTDEKLCSKINSSEGKDDCYYMLALYNGDSTICSKITDSLNEEYCLSEFYLEERDESILNQLSPEVRDNILFSTAMIDANISICNLITDNESTQYCYDVVSQIDEDGLIYYHLDEQGIELKLPAAWGSRDFVTEGIFFYVQEGVMGNMVDDADNIIGVFDQTVTLSEYSLSEYYNSYVNNVTELFDAKIVSSEDTTVDGFNAKKINFERELQGNKIIQIAVVTITTNGAYEFVFTTSPGKDNYELFDKIIDSIGFY
jgi:uncharacterized RDD family membrane protein YckC